MNSIAKTNTCYTVHKLNLKILNSKLRQSIKCCRVLGAWAVDRIAR